MLGFFSLGIAAPPANAGRYQLVSRTTERTITWNNGTPCTQTFTDQDPFEYGDLEVIGPSPGGTLSYHCKDTYQYRWVGKTIMVAGQPTPDPTDLPEDAGKLASATVEWGPQASDLSTYECTTTASASAGSESYDVTFGNESDGQGGSVLVGADPGSCEIYKQLDLTGLMPKVDVTFTATMEMSDVPEGVLQPYFSYMQVRRKPVGPEQIDHDGPSPGVHNQGGQVAPLGPWTGIQGESYQVWHFTREPGDTAFGPAEELAEAVYNGGTPLWVAKDPILLYKAGQWSNKAHLRKKDASGDYRIVAAYHYRNWLVK